MCAQRAQFSSTTRRHEAHSSIGRHKKKKEFEFSFCLTKRLLWTDASPDRGDRWEEPKERKKEKHRSVLSFLFFFLSSLFSSYHRHHQHNQQWTSSKHSLPSSTPLPPSLASSSDKSNRYYLFSLTLHAPSHLARSKNEKSHHPPFRCVVPCLAWMNNSDHAPCLFYWPIRYLYPHRQLSLAPLRHTRYDSLLHRRVCQRPYPYHCMTATSMIAFSHNAKPDPQPASHRNADKKRIQQGDNTNRLTTCQESDLSGCLILTEQCQQQQNPSLSLSSVTLSISFCISLLF